MKLYEASIIFVLIVMGMFAYPIYTTIKDNQKEKKQEYVPLPQDMKKVDEPCGCSFVAE